MSKPPTPDEARSRVSGDTGPEVSPPVSPSGTAADLDEQLSGDDGDSGDRHVVAPRSPRRVTWTAPELIAADFPEPTWAVPGIVTDGLTLLVGAPKAGKSWLAYGTAVAIASGGKALGRLDVKQGDVLYLALEDTGRRMQERLAKILAGADAPAALTVTIACDNAPAYIREWISGHKGARLVIIDVLARVRAPSLQDESRYDADYRLMAAIKAVADETGVPFLVLHHTRKMGSGDFVDEVSGTQGVAGAADAILVLRRMRGEVGGLLQVTGRDIEEADYSLSFAAGIGAWQMSDIPADEVLLGATRVSILRWLKSKGNEGSGPSAIAAGTKIALATVKQTVRRMVAEGQLDTDDHGHYFPPATGGDS